MPQPGQLAIRAAPGDEEAVRAVGTVLGVPLPLTPNTALEDGGRTLLWLGPDEWLLTLPFDEHRGLAAALEGALAGRHAAVVDVSAQRLVLELSGPHARDVLEKGCPLDLHPRVFGPGQCAQTLLARTALILEPIKPLPRYRLFVRASFARYLVSWIVDAMAEYL
jgi:sarcosine oxidase subunit gamma